jgi:O-antigen ligase
MVVSLSWSPAWTTGAQNAVVWATFVALLLASLRFAAVWPTVGRRLAAVLRLSIGVALALYGVSLAVGGLGGSVIWGNRTFAQFALLGLCWFLAGWRYRRPYSFAGATVVTVFIALSLSRMAFVVAIVLFLIAHFAGANWKRRVLAGLAAVCWAGFLGLSALGLFGPFRERFGVGQSVEAMLRGNSAAYTSGRVVMWGETWRSAVEAPWRGKGAGSAASHLEQALQNIAHPHNDYLRILHDYGILGLLLFVYGLARVARLCWRNWAATSGLLERRLSLTAGLVLGAVALMMVTDNTFVYVFVMAPLGILLGVTLGVRSAPDKAAGQGHIRWNGAAEVLV